MVNQEVILENELKVYMKCRRMGHDVEHCKGEKEKPREGSRYRERKDGNQIMANRTGPSHGKTTDHSS